MTTKGPIHDEIEIDLECSAISRMLQEKKHDLLGVSKDCYEHPTSRRLKDGRCFACYQQVWVRWKAELEAVPSFVECMRREKEANAIKRKQKASDYARKKRAEDPWASRSRDKERYKNPKRRESMYRNRVRNLYGLSLDEVHQMEALQGGRCAICNTDNPGTRRNGKIVRWHVDHCHSTGKVRGLLCVKCNTGLGNFKDSIDTLERAISYLRANQ